MTLNIISISRNQHGDLITQTSPPFNSTRPRAYNEVISYIETLGDNPKIVLVQRDLYSTIRVTETCEGVPILTLVRPNERDLQRVLTEQMTFILNPSTFTGVTEALPDVATGYV